MANRTVKVVLLAEYSQFTAGMARAAATTKAFGAEVSRATDTEKGRQNLKKVTDQTALMGASLLAVGGAAVVLEAQFDAAMSKVKANVDDKGKKSMDSLRAAALQAGRDTQYSALQAAQGEDELAKAGVSAKNIIGGGLKGALSLAAAGQLDVASAAEISASAMNDFKLSGAAIPHIADLLAAGADKAQGSVQDLGNALKYVGPVAGSMNVGIEQTVGVLTELASRGIMGEQAGTSLRGMLSSLTSPSAQARAEMQSLGIELYDSTGKFTGLANMAQQLHDKLGGMTGAQRDAALGTIFGNEQITAARVLYEGGAKAVNDYTKAVNDQGFAAQSAATKMDNLQGDLTKLRSSIETDLIQAGSGANTALRKVAQTGTELVNNFGAMPKTLQEGAVYMSSFAGAGLLAFSATTKLKSKLGEVKDSLTELGPAGAKASSALGTVATAGGKLALLATVSATVNAVADATRAAPVPVGKLAASLMDYAQTGTVAGDATAILGKNLSKFKSDIQNFGTGGWGKISEGVSSVVDSLIGADAYLDNSVNNARQRMDQLDQALVQLVASGHADQAKTLFNNLLKATKDQGGNLNDLKNALPQYSAALGDLAQSSANATTAQRAAADAGKTLAGSWQAAVDQGKTLVDVFNALNGAAVTSDSTAIKVTDSFDNLKKSLSDNGTALDINTTKGAANRQGLIDMGQAIRDAVQAKYQESGSLTAANAVYTQYIQQLRNVLTQAGFTQAQINDLINRYAAMPATVATKVAAPGATQSASQVQTLKDKEAELERKIDVLVKTNASTNELQRYQQQLDAIHDKIVRITTITQTDSSGTQHVEGWNGGGRKTLNGLASGGIIDFQAFAAGGFHDPAHVASIVPAGTYRLMAESETGGEAYIPLAAAKRGRSLRVWEEAGRRLGVPMGQIASTAPVSAPRVGAYPSADQVGGVIARHLTGPLGQIAALLAAGGVHSIQVDGREIMRAVDEARRVESYVG